MSLAHLAQMGPAGLEMAIRMGMGIGMSLQQPGAVSGVSGGGMGGMPVKQGSSSSLLRSAGSTNPPSPEATSSTSRQRSGDVVSEILNDDFFAARSPLSTSPPSLPVFASARRPSQTGEPGSPIPDVPEEMAKKDPLATQVWKAYARAKNTLPHGHRMENLTWRMMHLTMKKDTDTGLPVLMPQQGGYGGVHFSSSVQEQDRTAMPPPPEPAHSALRTVPEEDGERGRRKGKSRVVGFTAGNRDSRYVYPFSLLLPILPWTLR